MDKQKYCRYCGKRISKKSRNRFYCSDWCRQHWHYEEQEDLFYVPGMKQKACIVCGKVLFERQLKYCSKTCYFAGRYNRKREITAEQVSAVRKINV